MSDGSAENSSEPPLALSCDSRIGDDLIEDSSDINVPYRAVRSFQDNDSDYSDNDMTSAEKKFRRDELRQGLEKPGAKKSGRKEKKSERGNKMIASELIDSEEVSVTGSEQEKEPKNGLNEIENRIDEKNKTKAYFNLMLLGAASTGKTTFVECITKNYKRSAHEETVIRKHTEDICEVKANPYMGDLSLDFRIIDTPGFTHSSALPYLDKIRDEINRRQSQYEDEIAKRMTESSVYAREQREIQDCRVHCCLFFLRGPRLHEDDWMLIKKLQSMCNMLPVIAKGDCYSIPEIAELKKCVRQRREDEEISWFDVEEYIRQKYPQKRNLLDGPYGLSPPFMISCSTTQLEKRNIMKPAREFKWGTCEVDNPEHTEFTQLKTLLLEYLRQGLVMMTEVKKRTHREEMRKYKGEKIWRNTKGVLGLIVVGLLGTLAIKWKVQSVRQL